MFPESTSLGLHVQVFCTVQEVLHQGPGRAFATDCFTVAVTISAPEELSKAISDAYTKVLDPKNVL